MRRSNDDELDALLARCRRGDAAAWGQLMSRFEPLVYSIARKYGLKTDDSADVYSHTFHRFLKSLDRIDGGASIGRWLGVTAARESLRILRSNSQYATTDIGDASLDELVASEDRLAEEEAVAADQALRAREALARLNERCRGLLEQLYTAENPSYAEVSARSGVPVGAIGPTRARCLEKLRALLEARGFFE